MSELTLIREETRDGEPADALARIRREVDDVDARIVALLAERARLARSEALVRRSRGEAVEDPARDAERVRTSARTARELDLDEEAVRRIYWRVMELAQSARRGQKATTPSTTNPSNSPPDRMSETGKSL